MLAGYNDLATVDPDLAAEWDTTVAGKSPQQVTAGSNYRAPWRCSKGHRWVASVHSRKTRGCPECALAGTSRTEQSLHEALLVRWPEAEHRVRVRVPERVRPFEVDIRHRDLVVEYDGSYFHRGADALERDAAKTRALLNAGFVVVRVREQSNHALSDLPLVHERLVQLSHRYGDSVEDLARAIVDRVAETEGGR
ncbi:zinc-ribbon domain-containing protein [Nocardioides pakistanensis]